MATKMGQKRQTKPDPMRQISDKHAAALREYNKVRNQLFEFSELRSEISGKYNNDSSIADILEPHHIFGRDGDLLYHPFNIVILLNREHTVCQFHMSYEHKLELLAHVLPIRIRQGYKLSEHRYLVSCCSIIALGTETE